MNVDTEALLAESGWVRSLARSLAADAQRADDLAQETWLAALQGGPRQGVPLRRWIASVMRNLARQDRRGDSRRREREALVAQVRDGTVGEPTERVLARLEGHRAVVDAVTGLHEPYRSVVVLRYFDGLAPREIAERRQVPVRTVHTQLARGLSLLRARLEGRHGERASAWLPILGLLIGAERPGSLLGTTLGALLMDLKVKVAAGAVALVGLAVVTQPLWRSPVVVATTEERGVAGAELVQPVSTEPQSVPTRAPADSQREVLAVAAPAETVEAATALPVVRGRVIDTASRPVSGVAVRYRDGAGPGAQTYLSDAAGGLEIPWRDSEGALEVLDERWTVVLEPSSWSTVESDDNVLVVTPRITLAGIVVDDAGEPLAKAKVRVHLPLLSRSRLPTVPRYAEVRSWTTETDASGLFRLEAGVLPGGFLIARLTGYESYVHAQPTLTTLDLQLALQTPEHGRNYLRGLVIDEQSYPVEGARVALGLEHTRSDAEGRFILRVDANDERGVLTALKVGSLPARLERAAESNTAEGAWPDPLILQLGGPPLTISGRVLSAEGEPVPEIKVRLLDATRFGPVEYGGQEDFTMAGYVEPLLAGQFNRIEVVTDAHGTFRIEGLLPRAYQLAALDEDRMLYVESAPIEAGVSNATLHFPNQASWPLLAGRVLSLSGEPIGGVSVTLVGGSPSAGSEGRHIPPSFANRIHGASTRTDEEGRFEFRDVSSAVTHLSVSGESVGLGRPHPIPRAADLEDLKLNVPQSCRVRVELGASGLEASEFKLLDSSGEALALTMTLGNMMLSSDQAPFGESRSGEVSAPEDACTLVLYSNHVELLRMPVKLVPSELNLITL